MPPRDIRTWTLLGELNALARESRMVMVAELGRWESLQHTCLKQGEKRSVWKVVTSTEVVTLKCRKETLFTRIRYLFNHSPLHREIRGSETLTQAGIRTVAPLALYRGNGVQCLALRHVPGRTLLECMADTSLSHSQRRAIAVAVASQLVHMGREGVCNRDHKPSNIIIDEHVNGEPLVTVIDPAGVFQSPIPGWGMPQMLASLVIEPTGCGIHLRRRDVVRVLREVMRGANAAGTPESPPGFGHWPTVRDLLGATREIVAAHRNPVPTDNPLAPATRN